MPQDSLEKYRDEVREITRSILDLVVARQALAEKIAEAKERDGASVENYAVEAKLSEEMLEYAKTVGLEEELTEKVVRELIEYSKISQRRKIFLKSISAHLRSEEIRSVSVIGAGRMGGWFAKYFKDADCDVALFDPNKLLARKKARELNCRHAKTFDDAAGADLAVVAVPIKATPVELNRLARSSRASRVIEITSVKSEIEKTRSSFILHSIHPLFGPSANPFEVNSLIQISGPEPKFVEKLFPHYKIFEMGAEDHDRLMSTLLTIPHIHALSFADSVTKRRKSIPENIKSPSFDYMLDFAQRLLKESVDVYYDIEASNPFAKEAMNETMKSIARIKRLLRNRTAFREFFDEAGRELT